MLEQQTIEDPYLSNLTLLFSKYDLNWSCIALGQYIFESASPNVSFCILKSLHTLQFDKALHRLVQERHELSKFQEIRLLSAKSGFVLDYTDEPVPLPAGNDLEIPASFYKSVELFYTALSKIEKTRKKILLESFECDRSNLEPIIYLFRESLCNPTELSFLISQIPIKPARDILSHIMISNTAPISLICPLAIHALTLAPSFCPDALFSICVRNMEIFPNCEFIFQGMGIYYLKKKKAKEALKCFNKAIEINKDYGTGYLFAGIAHSFLKETECAVKTLNLAYSIMESSYIPSYCLAFEYQQMNNVQKAKHYFKRSLDIMLESEAELDTQSAKRYRGFHTADSIFNSSGRNICTQTQLIQKDIDWKVMNAFIYFLVYSEEYDDALKCIKAFNVTNALKVFCLLFTGMVQEAKNSLEGCEKDCVYYATKGFVCHLTEDIETAIEFYEKSLELRHNSIVEKLFWMACENKSGAKVNRAFDYSNCLFESLGFHERIFP